MVELLRLLDCYRRANKQSLPNYVNSIKYQTRTYYTYLSLMGAVLRQIALFCKLYVLNHVPYCLRIFAKNCIPSERRLLIKHSLFLFTDGSTTPRPPAASLLINTRTGEGNNLDLKDVMLLTEI